MKNLLFSILLLYSFIGFSQENNKLLQKEIDQQVWKPFKAAFENIDGEALNATYAGQVIRVTPEGIDTKNDFKAANLKRFAQNKTNGIKITLDFWFDSRKTNATTSYEVGFYRIGFINTKNETSYSYGQFHIVLQKIKGEWKITQDWDTTTINGHTIDAKDFANQEPLQF